MRFFRKPSLFFPELLSILLLALVIFACEGISSDKENSESNQADIAKTGENGFLVNATDGEEDSE